MKRKKILIIALSIVMLSIIIYLIINSDMKEREHTPNYEISFMLWDKKGFKKFNDILSAPEASVKDSLIEEILTKIKLDIKKPERISAIDYYNNYYKKINADIDLTDDFDMVNLAVNSYKGELNPELEYVLFSYLVFGSNELWFCDSCNILSHEFIKQNSIGNSDFKRIFLEQDNYLTPIPIKYLEMDVGYYYVDRDKMEFAYDTLWEEGFYSLDKMDAQLNLVRKVLKKGVENELDLVIVKL